MLDRHRQGLQQTFWSRLNEKGMFEKGKQKKLSFVCSETIFHWILDHRSTFAFLVFTVETLSAVMLRAGW